MIIDTHTHLESFASHGDLSGILERAREAGLGKMITIGTQPDDWIIYRELASRNLGFVHYTAGIHPCSVDENWLAAFEGLSAFFQDPVRPVALGEIGLDRFHLPKNDEASADKIFSWQRAAFERALLFAKEKKCPVVVHSRGAFKECVEMVDASGVDWGRVVFHCFTEGPAEMSVLMDRGGFGSFTGILTYKNAGPVRAAMLLQGLKRLMIETDAPYLTPMPHRGKPNEPAFLRYTAEFAAQLFGVGYEELAGATTATAETFFGI